MTELISAPLFIVPTNPFRIKSKVLMIKKIMMILFFFRDVYSDDFGNLTEGIKIETKENRCPNTTCRVHLGKHDLT